MRIFKDIEQNTDTWLSCRLGKVTASNFAMIMANYGKSFGEPAKKYAMRVALETITKKPVDTYSNSFMDRGHELEPQAREMYEVDTFQDVLPGGFMEYGRFGGSADGRVSNGLIEIKSVIYSTHFQRWIEGGYDAAYTAQMQGNMWLYEKGWCDFVSYCPEFPARKNLYIFRVDRDDEYIKRLEARLSEFIDLVDSYIKAIQ
jgi:hypothetical protein